jgi:hypothetical protein
LVPPSDTVAGALLERPNGYALLYRRLTDGGAGERPVTRATCQFQLFVESYQPLSPADLEKGRALFIHNRAVLRQLLRAE